MFEGLRDIDWNHFYNMPWADKIADMFEEVASPSTDPDQAIRRADFIGDIFCHQGTITEATYLALPYLFELARHVPIERQWRVVAILYNIARSASFRHPDIDIRPIEIEIYKYLCQQKNFFEKLLPNDNSNTRAIAALTFCLLEQDIEHRIKVISNRVRVESDPSVQVTLVQLLGYLIRPEGLVFLDVHPKTKSANDNIYFHQLEVLARTSKHKTVRLAAAVAILHIKRENTLNEYIEIIMSILTTLKQTETSHGDMYHVSKTLTYLGEERGVEQLIRAVKTANDPQIACSSANELLRQLFEYTYHYRYVSFETFSDVQRKAIQVIANNDKLWEPEIFPILESSGLPNQRHILLSILARSNERLGKD